MGFITLIRIAAIILVVWLLWKGVKSLMASSQKARDKVRNKDGGEVLDVMVQDPQCGTYVPKHEAITARIKGEEHHFCSEKCRDDFAAGKDKAK